jgi:hypothetical protein
MKETLIDLGELGALRLVGAAVAQAGAGEALVEKRNPSDIASMSREQRQALKRELLRQHPELA